MYHLRPEKLGLIFKQSGSKSNLSKKVFIVSNLKVLKILSNIGHLIIGHRQTDRQT